MQLTGIEPKDLIQSDHKIFKVVYGHFAIAKHPLLFATNKHQDYLRILKNNKLNPAVRAIALWLYEWAQKAMPKETNIVYHATTACTQIHTGRQIKSFLWYNNEINITTNFWHGLHTTLYSPDQSSLKVLQARNPNRRLQLARIILPFSIFDKSVPVFVQQRFAPQKATLIARTQQKLQTFKIGKKLLHLMEQNTLKLNQLAQKKLQADLKFRVLIDLLGTSLQISNFGLYTPEVLGQLFPNTNIKIVRQKGHTMVSWPVAKDFDLEQTIKKIPQKIKRLKHPEILGFWHDVFDIISSYYFKSPEPAYLQLLLLQNNYLETLFKWSKTHINLSTPEIKELTQIITDINSQLLLEEYLYANTLPSPSYFVNLEPNDANNAFIVLKQDNLPLKIKCLNKTFSATLRVEL